MTSWMIRGVIQFLTGNCHLDHRDCGIRDDDVLDDGLLDYEGGYSVSHW